MEKLGSSASKVNGRPFQLQQGPQPTPAAAVAGWRQAKPVDQSFDEYVRGLGVLARFGTELLRGGNAPTPEEPGGEDGPDDRLDAVVVDEAQDFPAVVGSLLACTTNPTR